MTKGQQAEVLSIIQTATDLVSLFESVGGGHTHTVQAADSIAQRLMPELPEGQRQEYVKLFSDQFLKQIKGARI